MTCCEMLVFYIFFWEEISVYELSVLVTYLIFISYTTVFKFHLYLHVLNRICFLLVRIEEIVDDEKPDELPVTEQSKKKDKRGSDNDDGSQKQIVLKSSNSVPVLESEDEDGFPISSTANEKGKRKKEADESDKSAKRKKDVSVTTDGPSRYGYHYYLSRMIILVSSSVMG